MKYIVIVAIMTLQLLQASTSSKEVCHTVQLFSKSYTAEKERQILDESYPSECKLMHIGSILTMRCGCFETKDEAEKLSLELEPEYGETLVTSTYKYRFQTVTKKVEKVEKVENTQPPIVEDVAEDIVAIATIKEQPQSAKATQKKHKKKHKKKKKHHKKKKNKKVQKLSLTKNSVSEKKEQKTKVVSADKLKRKLMTPYDRYLRLLKSRRAIGKYDYRYKFGAQFSYDIGYVDEANRDYDEEKVRKARVYHEGSFYDRSLFYEIEYSFLNKEYKDVLVGYKGKVKKTDYRVRVGNMKQPFALEQYSSSKNETFMEHSLNDAFYIDRQLGVELFGATRLQRNYMGIYLSVFSNSIDERIDGDDTHYGASTRVVYGYKFAKNNLLGVSAAFMSEQYDGETLKFKQGAESKLTYEKYASQKVKDVDLVTRKNIDLYYQYKNYAFQTAFTQVSLDSSDENPYLYSYNLEGSYFLFGSMKKYKLKEGKLVHPKIYRGGALEFAMRYTYLDLDDGESQTDYNFGVNWYVTNELRLLCDYVISQPTNTKDYDGLLQLLQARVEIAF